MPEDEDVLDALYRGLMDLDFLGKCGEDTAAPSRHAPQNAAEALYFLPPALRDAFRQAVKDHEAAVCAGVLEIGAKERTVLRVLQDLARCARRPRPSTATAAAAPLTVWRECIRRAVARC